MSEKYYRRIQRKYSGDPYIVHPLRVAVKLWEDIQTLPKVEEQEAHTMVAVALLHDIIEDGIHPENLKPFRLEAFEIFGEHTRELLELTLHLTNNKALKGQRVWRKFAMEIQLRGAPLKAKVIKLADRLDNVLDFIKNDPEFLKNKYAGETRHLIDSCLFGTASFQEAWEYPLLKKYADWVSSSPPTP